MSLLPDLASELRLTGQSSGMDVMGDRNEFGDGSVNSRTDIEGILAASQH